MLGKTKKFHSNIGYKEHSNQYEPLEDEIILLFFLGAGGGDGGLGKQVKDRY